MGFKFSSLMKLVDVKAKAQSGVTLLHTIAQIIEEKEPDLLLFVEEMDALKDAESAINVAQAAILFMRKSAADLDKEVKALTDPSEQEMKEFFEATLVDCKEVLATHDEKIVKYSDMVQFFGEQSANDIAGFFQNWSKFVSNFRAAVKFNIALNKKREAEERKAREDREKKKADKNLKKFADTLRASRKTGPSDLLKQGQQMDEAANNGEGGTISKRGRRSRARKTKPTQSVVDDIISDNIEFLEGPSADVRDDNGVVQQISRGLRSGDTFSRLRGKRTKKTHVDSTELMDVEAEIGTSPSTKRQLRSQQKSTFSRKEGKRLKKEKKKHDDESGRVALTSIDWG